MQTHPISDSAKASLCQAAIEATLLLNFQLHLLLDAYDFYVQRFQVDTDSTAFQLRDVQVSVNELGKLPHEIAHWLSNVRNEHPNLVSSIGFEQNVLNEFALHMHSLALFLHRKEIDLGDFNARLFGRAMETLRQVNRRIG